MIVCVCNRVNEATISKLVGEGCTLNQIRKRTLACTSCKLCQSYIEDMIAKQQESAKAAS